MGEIWIKEAERLGDGKVGGEMDTPDAPPRAVWHTTESGAGDDAFTNVGAYLIAVSSEPHILYDPLTDRLGQYGPLNESARALKNAPGLRTNRTGKVCVQIEVLARAAKPFTAYFKPGKNFKALIRALRSWGIPDVWPAGALAKAYNDDTASRSAKTWMAQGGHYGHCNIPGNDHWDPGNIDQGAIFRAAPVETKPPTKPPTTPVVDLSNLIAAAHRDPGLPQGGTTHPTDVRIVEAALKAEGLLGARYAADGSFGTLTREAYTRWQLKLYPGASTAPGGAADGIPGRASLEKLGAKRGFTVKA
ncbi:peptidoglycan-binding domain-containing protein [Streptomyces sp. NBC_00239]|uniref:peptidoglycan-binding domain-containing protein n=1 Tax=Streptomyces sp. NBC_00239 TaxID=2903640 RepID=UPI002E28A9A4|nr:peptidoglycan-binding domain-containing protein [Streptomyces sp. NBC_00239]